MSVISRPCSIKGCDHFVQVDLLGMSPDPRDFVLCNDCEACVMLDIHILMERQGEVPGGTAKMFATVFNGWRRKHKGVTFPHRPTDIGFARPLVLPLGDEGKGN